MRPFGPVRTFFGRGGLAFFASFLAIPFRHLERKMLESKDLRERMLLLILVSFWSEAKNPDLFPSFILLPSSLYVVGGSGEVDETRGVGRPTSFRAIKGRRSARIPTLTSKGRDNPNSRPGQTSPHRGQGWVTP